jgi:hypothetical protein
MKSNHHRENYSPYYTACVLTIALVSLTLPAASVQALSCLNPTEMVDQYVTDPAYSIALVTAGSLETEGTEHDQSVAVVTSYKGAMSDTVTFTHDETWDYLCAGTPAAGGSEAVYITSDDRVTQVVELDTPLYDTLMAAFDTEPTTPNTPLAETKRTLMERAIDLLQQLLSLLQLQATAPTEPEPSPAADLENFLGMTEAEAVAYAATIDTPFRVVEIDGEQLATTKDYRPGRINAVITDGIVTDYTVEGEDDTTPAEPASHDAIIGLSEAAAEAYAVENDVPFRVGRRDGEYLPVTMDYRPGRITAEIEDGIVVAYSVE